MEPNSPFIPKTFRGVGVVPTESSEKPGSESGISLENHFISVMVCGREWLQTYIS